MNISVFGLGYVGTVSAACFASRGHTVVGVDINPTKVDLLNAGSSPIVEPNVQPLIEAAKGAHRISAVTSAADAICQTDLSFICVGTPSKPNGGVNTEHLAAVCEEIGGAIAKKNKRHTVAIRSTIPPGTCRSVILPILERASGKKAGRDIGIVLNPEFLREGTAIADFLDPPKTVIGAQDEHSVATVKQLYEDLPGPFIVTSIELAEFVKYVDNPWHALKVAFANEIGNLCKVEGVDSRALMEIFALDRKLNISSAYLTPGFAFGGSCLPKDVRAMAHLGRTYDLNLPVLNSILQSNNAQIERGVDWVLSQGKRKIAVLGCSFKADTDDMRESPFIILIERLLGKGLDVKVFDNNVQFSVLVGANREYVMATVPHITRLLVPDAESAIKDAEIIIVTNNSTEYLDALRNRPSEAVVLDFAGIDRRTISADRYKGVNW